MFAGLRAVVIDEVHALAGTKRGDQLALCLARIGTLAPGARRIGLSATVAHRKPLEAYVAPGGVRLIEVTGGAAPEIDMQFPPANSPGPATWGSPARPKSSHASAPPA